MHAIKWTEHGYIQIQEDQDVQMETAVPPSIKCDLLMVLLFTCSADDHGWKVYCLRLDDFQLLGMIQTWEHIVMQLRLSIVLLDLHDYNFRERYASVFWWTCCQSERFLIRNFRIISIISILIYVYKYASIWILCKVKISSMGDIIVRLTIRVL
jgi:hypothetical protein